MLQGMLFLENNRLPGSITPQVVDDFPVTAHPIMFYSVNILLIIEITNIWFYLTFIFPPTINI